MWQWDLIEILEVPAINIEYPEDSAVSETFSVGTCPGANIVDIGKPVSLRSLRSGLPKDPHLMIPCQVIGGGAHLPQVLSREAAPALELPNHSSHQPFEAQIQAWSMPQLESLEEPPQVVSPLFLSKAQNISSLTD